MLKRDYQLYKLTITTLTPLHIGNGKFLLKDYDFAARDGKVWRFNEENILENQKVDDAQTAALLAKQKPVNLLVDDDYKEESKLFRYVVDGEPQAEEGKVHEFIKGVDDQPYIPGSTLKGALRTTLGWSEWEAKNIHTSKSQVYDKYGKRQNQKTFAQNEYEGDIFGKRPYDAPRGTSNPNYDLMRAMIISDSGPLSHDVLYVNNVAVFRRGERGEKIDRISSLEVVASQKVFEVDLKIDTALFSDWAYKKGLNLGNKERLTEWIQLCKAHTHQRIENEIDYYQRQKSKSVNAALDLYQKMLNAESRLGDNTFWIQLGWGTGWDDKTFGSRLKENEEYMQTIIREYNLGKKHTYPSGKDFPMSRRLPKNNNNTLGKPLGWVRVDAMQL